MSREYYPCRYRFRQAERLLIWFTNDVDGVFADDQFKIPTFPTIEALRSAFPSLVDGCLALAPAILHDLDFVESRCRSTKSPAVDCGSFLAAWNLLADVARSVGDSGFPFLESDRALDHEYEKLFFGSNLPAITPPGQCFKPSWIDDEFEAIRCHFRLGLELFEQSLYAYDHGTGCGGAAAPP